MDILEYFSGTGKIYIGSRQSNGNPGALNWVGDALMEFGFTPNETEFKENWTGQRGTALKLPGETAANLNLTFLQFNYDNLVTAMRGERKTQATAAFTDRVLSATLPSVGDFLSLNAFDVSAVTLKDSTPTTPKNLVLDTNYRLDAKTGMVEIINTTTGGPFVAPILGSATPGATDFVKMMSGSAQEYWVRFVGDNTVPGAVHKKVVADFYRWSPSPTETLSLIQDGASRLESPIAGGLLADSTKTASDEFGYYGRIALLTAA